MKRTNQFHSEELKMIVNGLPVVGAICVPLELTESSAPGSDQLVPSRLIESVKVVLKNQRFRG